MSRTRLSLVALGVVGVSAVLVWAVAAPGRHSASSAAAPALPLLATSIPVTAADPSMAPSWTPPPTKIATPSPPSAAAATRTPGRVAAVAEPYVQDFAGQPGAKPLPKLPSPTVTHSVRANVDGCDHNYGEVTQCVPWTFPPGTADKCDWLRERGFKELRVAGTDRQKLDDDHDGVAC